MNEYHNSVLLSESIVGLAIKKNGTYVDLTFGGGGHSKAILDELGAEGRLFAFDRDKQTIDNVMKDDRLVFINENFKYFDKYLDFYNVSSVDGILADLGVSSNHFDSKERGFSFRFDNALDMRMDIRIRKTAKNVVNFYSEKDLTRVFRDYGEIKQAKRVAKEIIEFRKEGEISTTFQLKELFIKFCDFKKINKDLSKFFQALRIEVNGEIESLKEVLFNSVNVLKAKARICIISYHSVEDRLVKRFFRDAVFEGEPERDIYGNRQVRLKPVGKLLVPSETEIATNNRARSAKLRIAEKI